ncbi:putative clathrin assembly protein At5g35200 [Durio zibethinus]|uniref:Clathrin assembly protein At5g35200 n=1 Tax=Durio zibethinus TaxID=66656 RepID=A0A6P5ZS46_DURZI|nr:putative clathrin assembly protein At5g35200 [Durio zibethinus]
MFCWNRMGTSSQHGLRKAIGALKDTTKVGLARVNADDKMHLDVAIVKATNHEEVVPKEKHVRTLLNAVSASSRSDVAFCIHALLKRLAKTHTWTVALKTLIIVHRALRADPSFNQELIVLGRDRGLMLNAAHFTDDSSPQAWNYSVWIRAYALYLEERIECFHVLKYDVDKDQSRNRRLDTPHLLEQLPVLQELLHRLLSCKPEGAALYNHLIHYALSIIVGESVRLYIAITDGILNLVDKYFEMKHRHAVKALQIYRKAGNQASQLSEFFEICRGLHHGQGQKYLRIKPLPESFLTAMEDYVKEAPEVLALPYTAIKDDQDAAPNETPTPESDLLIDYNQDTDVQEKSSPSVTSSDQPQNGSKQAVAKLEIADLLCFDDPTEDEKSSLALAIVESENPSIAGNDVSLAPAATGWELALFCAPSSNGAAIAENNLIGELDRVTLDSLYDQAMATTTTNQERAYNFGQVSMNPFEDDYNQDIFCGSSNVTPRTDVQMAAMTQQLTYIMQQQQQQQQSPMAMVGYDSTNPFGNPFVEQSVPSHPPDTHAGLI